MKKRKITLLNLAYTFALGIAISGYVGAQKTYAQQSNIDLIEVSNQKLPKFSTYSEFGSFNYNLSEFNLSSTFMKTNLVEWMKMDGDHRFELIREYTDELGIKHSVFQHYYKDVKVQDEILLLHEKNNIVQSVNGQISSIINVSNLSEASLDNVKNSIQQDLETESELNFGESENVIVPVLFKGSVKHHFATKIAVIDFSQLQAFDYYVDNAGVVVSKLSKRYDADTPSTSTTYYKGNQQIIVDSFNGSYRLKDNSRNIHTLNASNVQLESNGGIAFNGDGTMAGSSEYTNSSANFTGTNTRQGVEVHWGMKVSYDYYINRHNRSSYDGNGSLIRNYSNFTALGMNAAAIDQSGIVAMVYGTGGTESGVTMNPVVGIDVAGHEYSHLIIGRNGLGGLNYVNESGALNESIADMFGAAIEFYSGVNPNWTIGEGILTNAPGFMRSMSNPNSGPAALASQQPDTYHGTHWVDILANPATANQFNDFGGVHTNSGVGNYWFYLLSVGGSGTNDIGNQYNVTGIGIEKAERIIYRALTNYMTPNSTYQDAFNATKQAVVDIYGNNGGPEWQNNIRAWYAVGFGDNNLSNNELQLEGKLSVYPNPVQDGIFTIDSNLENDATYELFDVSGKQIISATSLDLGSNQVNVHGLQSGVYLIKINSGGASASKKIIIK